MLPTIQPVSAEDAASTGIAYARCRIVISQDWIPAPAIDDTMKKAKNIITDRPSSRRAPEIAGWARSRGARRWSTRMRLCHRIVSTTGTPRSPTKVNAPRQPISRVKAAVAGGATAKPMLPTKV